MADFIDIPIDVTAEQIEEMAKRQVDTVAKKGSGNLITSDAVAMVEIDSENILPDTVETGHIKSKAVTGAKIADDSVDSEHIKLNAVENGHIAEGAVTGSKILDGVIITKKLANNAVTKDKIALYAVGTDQIVDDSVTPNKLDRLYVESISTPIITSYSQLDGFLTPSDGVSAYNTLYKITFAPSFPAYGLLGGANYIGFVSDRLIEASPRLVIVNTENLEAWSYIKYSADFDKITAVDQIFNPDSENAQSGIAVNEAFEIFKEQYQQIAKVTLEEVTYKALLEAVRTHGAIMFDTLTEHFTGAETALNLPLGCYVAFYEHGQVACWHFDSGVLYKLVGLDLFDTGDYTFYVTSSFVELENKVGNIDTALDNIIAIQESYIGGEPE